MHKTLVEYEIFCGKLSVYRPTKHTDALKDFVSYTVVVTCYYCFFGFNIHAAVAP